MDLMVLTIFIAGTRTVVCSAVGQLIAPTKSYIDQLRTPICKEGTGKKNRVSWPIVMLKSSPTDLPMAYLIFSCLQILHTYDKLCRLNWCVDLKGISNS
jgi:hypothetical protein